MKSSLIYRIYRLASGVLPLAVFLAMCFAVIVPVSADAAVIPVISYATDGYRGSERGTFAPPDAVGTTELDAFEDIPEKIILEMESGNWNFTGLAENSGRVNVSGVMQAGTNMPDPEEESISDEALAAGGSRFTLDISDYNIDVSSYSELRVGVSVIAGEGMYPIVIEAETERGVYTSTTYIESDGWNLVCADLSEAEGRLGLVHVTFGFGYDNMPISTKVTAPVLTSELSAGMECAHELSTDKLSAEMGTVTSRGGRVKPDDGSAYIVGTAAFADRPDDGDAVYFEIRLRGVDSGNMSVGVLYKGYSEEYRVFSKKISLESPDGIYTIPFSAEDDIVSYALQFDNVECDTYFNVDSVKIYSGKELPPSGNRSLGTVSSIIRSGQQVTFSGTMERDAAADHSGESIYFCALPGNSADDLFTAVEIGEVKVSTRFEYTADLAKYPADADTFMFFAAVKGEDGELIPLSRPRYCDTSAQPDTGVSGMGIYGGATVGVFESNMSHVIVDLPLDKLIITSEEDNADGYADKSSVTTSYAVYKENGQGVASLSLSRDFLADIDREVDFYLSAGIGVCLRLTAPIPVEGLTYTEEDTDSPVSNYAFRTGDDNARQMYAAVVRFLSDRYRGLDGFIIGMAVNDESLSGGAVGRDAAVYSYRLADLCRITYNAASVANPDILVIVPFAESGQNDSVVISDRSAAVMISDALSYIGNIPWAFMYMFDEAEDNLLSTTSLDRLFGDLEIRSPYAYMFFYEPKNDYLVKRYRNEMNLIADMNAASESGEEQLETVNFRQFAARHFGEIADICTGFRARAVFCSIKNLTLTNNHEFYINLKDAVDSDGFVHSAEAEKVISDRAEETYLLWDFSDKYHALDWISVGGNSSCITESSSIFVTDGKKTRALRAGFVDDNPLAGAGGAGIALCNFDHRVDFSAISELEFTFAFESAADAASEEEIVAVFVIGNSESRAEYYAGELAFGEIYTMKCDLTEFSDRSAVDYVGIMIYSDSDVYLELSSVGVRSENLSPDEIGVMLTASSAEEEYVPNYRLIAVFAFTAAAFSVVVCILLIRRDREAEEETAANAGYDDRQRKTTHDERVGGRRRY